MARGKWIQKAIKREGVFTEWCKRHGFRGVNKACIEKAKEVARRTKNRTLMGQAILAERMKYGDIARANKRRRKRKR